MDKISGEFRTVFNPFFGESRVTFAGIKDAPIDGIRFHNSITSFFLKIFTNKIIDLIDNKGNIYHVNRNSLSKWLLKNNDLHHITDPNARTVLMLNTVLEARTQKKD